MSTRPLTPGKRIPFFMHVEIHAFLAAIIAQIDFYLGTTDYSFCGLDDNTDNQDPNTAPCEEGVDGFPITFSDEYSKAIEETVPDGDGGVRTINNPFTRLYDGCEIGSNTVLVVTSIGIILVFVSLLLDSLAFSRKFDKPRLSTLFLILGTMFFLAALLTWVLTCQNTSTNLYPDITIGTPYILQIVAIVFGGLSAVVRIFRIADFKYEAKSYI